MIDLRRNSRPPGLLVSVRNEAEALTALAAGADVIDVKEPERGSLGAADVGTIAAVVRAVQGRALVTAAMGELAEFADGRMDGARPLLPSGVSLFKFGLAGCGDRPDWQSQLGDAIGGLRDGGNDAPRPVAVVYADWRKARSPSPEEVLEAALKFKCPALLVDTWDKSEGDLFAHWPIAQIELFVERVRASRVAVVLAGSLAGASISRAVELGPDIIAVRGAACTSGRTGAISADKVRELKELISAGYGSCGSGLAAPRS